MKKLYTLLLDMVIIVHLFGQLYPFTTDYLLNRKLLIPASGAQDNFLSVSFSYDKKWILPASPNRANMYINMNFRHHGINLGLFNQQIVLFNDRAAQLGYYYKLMIKQYRVVFAVNGSFIQDRLDFNKLNESWTTDPTMHTLPKTTFYPQLGLSSFIYTDKIELGLSLANIVKSNGYSYGNINTIYPMSICFYASAFYKHPLEYYLLKVQLFSYYSIDKQFFIEPSASFMIKNFIKAGGLVNVYIHNKNKYMGVGLILGIRLKNFIVLNYVFRYTLLGQAIAYTRVDNGLSITFNIFKKKEIAPRYF